MVIHFATQLISPNRKYLGIQQLICLIRKYLSAGFKYQKARSKLPFCFLKSIASFDTNKQEARPLPQNGDLPQFAGT
jgi:hypothetical protein